MPSTLSQEQSEWCNGAAAVWHLPVLSKCMQ